MKNENTSLLTATGPVRIPMTNDYLFRAMLQRNNRVLKGLICSLLHMTEDQIQCADITNPIILGEAVNEKQFFLDVNVRFNDNAIIDLEMQVINEYNWPERSLSYLCRNFDNLNSGQDYQKVKTAIQVGILDFTLFPEHPQFYSTYKLLNVKNYSKYSDKLQLSVLDLTQINLATEEDRACHIDLWAALFRATTWEEIKMLAQKDEYINEASNTIYELTQEEKIRLQCQAREDYYRREQSKKHYMEEQDARIAKQDTVIAEKDAIIAGKNAEIAEKDAEICRQSATIASLKALLKSNGIDLEDK